MASIHRDSRERRARERPPFRRARLAFERLEDRVQPSVDLSAAFNHVAMARDGAVYPSTWGWGGNGAKYTESATLLGSQVNWNGDAFTLGPANANNGVTGTGQTIALPAGAFASLDMVAFGIGARPNLAFAVNYTDGSKQTFTQSISDWGSPQHYTGESTAATMAYRDMSTGQKLTATTYLYGYSFLLTRGKTAASVTLPVDGNIAVLGMAMKSGAAAPTVSGVSPRVGPTLGGNDIVITGANFAGATSVKFGSAPAPAFSVSADGTMIFATSPGGVAGTVDVTVATAAGTSARGAADQFTYSARAVSFKPQVSYPVGTTNTPFLGSYAAEAAATGDFNGDGRQDIVQVHNADGAAYVLLGNGDGTFRAAVGYATGISGIDSNYQGAQWVTVADINKDGPLDLIVSGDDTSGRGVVSILLGNGNGTFRAATATVDPITNRSGAVVADFNGDGKLDVATDSDQSIPNSIRPGIDIFLGNGDGTLKAPYTVLAGQLPSDGNYARGLAVFSAGGITYLAVACAGGVDNPSNNAQCDIVKSNGDGTFAVANRCNVPYTPTDEDPGPITNPEVASAGDLNADGKTDLVVSLYHHNIAVLLGNGNGTFQPAVGYTTGEYPRAVRFADFNGDGKMDIAVSNIGSQGEQEPGSVAILLGNGDGTLEAPIQIHPVNYLGQIAVADFNADGRPDLAVPQVADGHAVAVLLNQTSLSANYDRAYVQNLYLKVLGRAGDNSPGGEVDYWVGQLAVQGRSGVAHGILYSNESLNRIVGNFYTTYLGRPADPQGLSSWVASIQHGTPLEQVESSFVSSSEYISRLTTDYASSLYLNVLHRPGASSEVAYWNAQIPVLGYSGVAINFTASYEHRVNTVNDDYKSLLNRPASSSEAAAMAAQPGDLLAIEMSILVSDEFYALGS